MARARRFKEIEYMLDLKSQEVRENILDLDEDDFGDAGLTASGYHYLKQQCEYLDMSTYIKIMIPRGHKAGLREKLEDLSVNEYRHIKQDRLSAFWVGLLFLVLSVAFAVLALFVELWGIETIFIISWVFGWYAIDKWFFDRNNLKRRKDILLQILSADLIESKE